MSARTGTANHKHLKGRNAFKITTEREERERASEEAVR